MNIKIKGGQVISGEITPSGSKNSALHLLPATLLISGKVKLKKIPEVSDVDKIVRVLTNLGSKITWDKVKEEMEIDNFSLSYDRITQEDLNTMKGSALLWGGLLGRFKKLDVTKLPGGCTLGIRPFEPFFKSFRDLNIKVDTSGKGVIMNSSHARSAEIWMSEMAVSVTSTLVMIAVTLPGKTKITGTASEPQCQDVCNFLVRAGAKISGIGTSVIEIDGGHPLQGNFEYELLSDHYEIATFLALGAVTGGEVRVHNSQPELFPQIVYEFSKFNVNIEYQGTTAIVPSKQDVKFTGSFEKKTNIVRAQPWPGLPVDLLPIFVPLALVPKSGYMLYHNWMYEAGLFWTSELLKFGAEVIMCDPHRVVVMAGNQLHGAVIEAPYIIRAVVALVMAGMIAEGESTILNADALYRGHPHFAENLKRMGAVIEEIK